MRGRVPRQPTMFVAFDLEQVVSEAHPLRKVKQSADSVPAEMGRDFNRAYGRTGKPGIPPARLILRLRGCRGNEHWLVSPDHFTTDGTLIRSLASHKSLRPIDPGTRSRTKDDDDASGTAGQDTALDWRGRGRSNSTHRSTTDPEARPGRKGNGKKSHLCHGWHVMMENRSGLCPAVTVDTADGHAERRNALRMLRHVERRHGLVPRTTC